MRILYFAEIKEIIGKGEDIINIQNATSLNDLIENLKKSTENFHIYTFGGLKETNKWLEKNNYA